VIPINKKKDNVFFRTPIAITVNNIADDNACFPEDDGTKMK